MELDYVRGLKGGKILSKYKLGSELKTPYTEIGDKERSRGIGLMYWSFLCVMIIQDVILESKIN
ncbi:hypothetical protein MAR_034439 [Mya arenaria]|uniref:Uncharacterized protein n=1 Tax=Mya arenaria TaxID=6604 RepID=A0ABY7GBX0_MYAAR|nr:hypothetical protein MAR_034439 [Mya arenaria]